MVNHFGGGFLANSTPFSMLPFRPVVQASSNFFSLASMLFNGLVALTTPEACKSRVSWNGLTWTKWELCTYPKLDWNGEKVDSGSLCDGLSSFNARKVDKAGFNNSLLAPDSLENLLRETNCRQPRAVCHGLGHAYR